VASLRDSRSLSGPLFFELTPRAVADQLAAYTHNGMNNSMIQNATAIYSLYFDAVSLHHMGDDPHAEEAVYAGMKALEQLKKQGGYQSLYDNVRPLFVDIQSRIAGHYD